MKPVPVVKWKTYSVVLYVNTLVEATFLVRAVSGKSARRNILVTARGHSEWVGKRLAAESMRIKNKHLTESDIYGFISR